LTLFVSTVTLQPLVARWAIRDEGSPDTAMSERVRSEPRCAADAAKARTLP